MLDHAKEAVDLLSVVEKADLASNRMLELALVRLIEIVGEAANGLSIEDHAKSWGGTGGVAQFGLDR
jgi:uncharacterized protein with HEPN domain